VSGLILKGFDLNNLKGPEKDFIFQQAREKVKKKISTRIKRRKAMT